MRLPLSNSKLDLELKKVLSDKKSGSAELLEKLNLFFLNNFDKISQPKLIISFLKNYFTSFQNIKTYLLTLEQVITNREKAIKYFSKFIKDDGKTYLDLYKNSLPYLKEKKSILTISNSKTVYEILKNLSVTNKPKIFICESRPKYEGRLFANKLSMLQFPVQVITEAQIAEYVKKCDCVLIGADMVLNNGSVVNKIGSLTIAICSKYYRKPFYVVAGNSKFTNKNKFIQKEEKQSEIWNITSKRISIKNYYFEKIPGTLITKIFSN